MNYELLIGPKVLSDIRLAFHYYEEQQIGLGLEFETALHTQFESLKKNPYFAIRYDQVRCSPPQKFPYMIHFTVDESTFINRIHAVLNTSRNPQIWNKRRF